MSSRCWISNVKQNKNSSSELGAAEVAKQLSWELGAASLSQAMVMINGSGQWHFCYVALFHQSDESIQLKWRSWRIAQQPHGTAADHTTCVGASLSIGGASGTKIPLIQSEKAQTCLESATFPSQ